MLRNELPDGISVDEVEHTSINFDAFVGPGPDYVYVGDNIPLIGKADIQPQIGDEVFFLGLFTQHSGPTNNLPIARFGHISQMPSELELTLPGNIRFNGTAYLMEFQAWGQQRRTRFLFAPNDP